ncbi:hypothetical protein IGI04_023534 [Brassica rapa subsp. trilocularis]|uniref:Uncharacterized protein n=1 Tax=Brassica rapa subsp. trilocularis TaxID=1813537 RepID=A0ABQ7M431_BRACM|nr:hypothetical protein IGI04_023534 [Brassica rapa subsp. trilocularis]
MEGSPYRKFSIFWKGARFQGPNSEFLLEGTWSVPLIEIMVRRPYKISTCEVPRWLGHGSASFLGLGTAVETRFMPRTLVFGDHYLLLMKVCSTSMKRVVTFIHRSDQVRRPPAWLSVSILRLRGALCSGAVFGDLVYVRQGTRVLRGPGLASRCNFEGLRGRPCGAVDIGTLSPLGCFLPGFRLGIALYQVVDLRILGPFLSCPNYSRRRKCIGCALSGVGSVQVSHGPNSGIETMLLVSCCVEGLIMVLEDSVLRLKLA